MIAKIDEDVRESPRVEVDDPGIEPRSDGPREGIALGAVS